MRACFNCVDGTKLAGTGNTEEKGIIHGMEKFGCYTCNLVTKHPINYFYILSVSFIFSLAF